MGQVSKMIKTKRLRSLDRKSPMLKSSVATINISKKRTTNKQIEYLGDVMLPHIKSWTLKELVFIKGNRINFK